VDRKAIFRKVRQIVAEQLGISPRRIHMRSHYIYDLSAG
jgi:hypothetical protein